MQFNVDAKNKEILPVIIIIILLIKVRIKTGDSKIKRLHQNNNTIFTFNLLDVVICRSYKIICEPI